MDWKHEQQLHPLVGKRPRSDYDVPGGHGYLAHEDVRGTHQVAKGSDTIGASYDLYLRDTQFPRDIESARLGIPHPSLMGMGPPGSVVGMRAELSLPPDASSTLFVEGLPSDCTRREVAHIFRPFVGYKEVRLVTKGSRHLSGDPFVLCFVDFESPAEAATAKDALQGYKFDEHDRDSLSLRMQFARNPGVKAGGAARPSRRGRR